MTAGSQTKDSKMAGYRVRVLRLNDNIVIFDSEVEQPDVNVTIVDTPGVGSWTYYIQVLYIVGTSVMLTSRNTIQTVAFTR